MRGKRVSTKPITKVKGVPVKWIAKHPMLFAMLVLCLSCYALGAQRTGHYLGNGARVVVSSCVNFGAGLVQGVTR